MKLAIAAVAALLAVAGARADGDPLPTYNIDPALVTVGGLSSGGFMAVQMHVAYSSLFKASSVWAGGPYYCAQGSESTALTTCMNPLMGPPNAGALAAATWLSASANKIDMPTNLTSSRVYVYSGTDDQTVHRPVVTSLISYLNMFINASEGGVVHSQLTTPSAHCFPTLNYGEVCSQRGSPYIGKCDYDSAGDAMKIMYGDGLKPRGTYNIFNRHSFDQAPFTSGGNPGALSLGPTGYVYVPSACANASSGVKCGLHMNFHGCQQGTANIGTDYVDHVGLSEWGETNNIIIVYPQAKSSLLSPSNPEGCWDWWGYTNADYAVRDGPQMAFAAAIVKHMMGGSSA